MLSSNGKSLKELNENETFVKRIVWVCEIPTSKSYNELKIKLEELIQKNK